MLRTADGLGVTHVFLCGITPLPSHPGVHDTALGAEAVVSWSYHAHVFEVFDLLEGRDVAWVALERTPQATDLGSLRLASGPVGLVVGNEPAGVSPEVLRACPTVAQLPMQGVKNSLNVAVVAGIGVFAVQQARLAWEVEMLGKPGQGAPAPE